MTLTDFQNLAYLHDATCLEIAWNCTSPSGRILRLSAVVDVEAGFPLWDGKELIITLSDVVATRFTGWGFQTGKETIDAWRQGVSDSLEQECQSLQTSGILVPSLRFLVTFRSGSCLEVVCSAVSVVEKR
jgi:hypothetical protein